jgi:hypothetical protein
MGIGFKKFIIVLIYLLILAVIGFFIYLKYKPKPSCFDSVQNQNEESVDCGGICEKKCEIIPQQNIQVGETGAVDSGINGQYDFYAQAYNPNNLFGAKSFQYNFQAQDSSGKIIAQKSGSGFLLPGEKKYIIEGNVAVLEIPARVNFSVTSTEWVEFNGDYLQKPDLKVVNKEYNEIVSGVGFSEAKGLVKNESPFDFNLIKIQVILRDSQNKIVALNSTQMSTVKAGENRDFRVFWPNRFSGSVSNVEVQTDVNVFSSEAFVRQYFKVQPLDRE